MVLEIKLADEYLFVLMEAFVISIECMLIGLIGVGYKRRKTFNEKNLSSFAEEFKKVNGINIKYCYGYPDVISQ